MGQAEAVQVSLDLPPVGQEVEKASQAHQDPAQVEVDHLAQECPAEARQDHLLLPGVLVVAKPAALQDAKIN